MATHTPPRSMDEDPTIRLRTLALFSDLPVDELDQIATTCDLCTAHPGQVIQAQDVPVRRWHLLIGGHAIVQRHGRPIGLLGRGDSWSEHSLLNRQPSPIAVVALSPVTMLTFGQLARPTGSPRVQRTGPDQQVPMSTGPAAGTGRIARIP
jgi:signal-transduction protein with cAMP-binding, CBS, and nucleotidyltransferase domain